MVKLDNAHYTIAEYRQRITTKEWKEILLNREDIVAFKGNLYRLKGKNIGAGVYEIYKDLEN